MLRFGSEPDERVPSNLRDRLLEGRVGSIAVGSYEGRPMCWESRVGSKLEKRRSCGYLKSEIAGQSIISFDYLVLTLTYSIHRTAGIFMKRAAKTSTTDLVSSELGPGDMRRVSRLGNVTRTLASVEAAPRRRSSVRANALAERFRERHSAARFSMERESRVGSKRLAKSGRSA